ncbi:MAG: hypothetical protein CM1200mP18_22560 [Gammaproteobacteria bacterium]|nr:MAG: hypothetical protein CM1200mP18_22560 [Gammaproteobacteria bacterium]
MVVHSGWWEPETRGYCLVKIQCLHPRHESGGIKRTTAAIASSPGPNRINVKVKPPHLTWEQAACYMLCASTAYRMLMGWSPNIVEDGDVVLVWGAAGGLGSLALQIVTAQGGKAVAVVSDEEKRQFCLDKGAVGVINRNEFDHWGPMPDTASKEWGTWMKGARGFGKAIWDAVGERKNPKIVFEHPGESTLPTSGFVCDLGV